MSIQTLGSAFLEKIRKVQNSKYESDLLKNVDCLLDGYGSVNSSSVDFFIINWIFLYKKLSESV